MTARLFANELRKNNNNKRVHDKSDEHNLRLAEDNPNYDPSLSHKNHIEIFNPETGQLELVATPTPDHLAQLRQYQKQLFDSVFEKPKSNKTTDALRTEKHKHLRALESWIDGAKTHETERQFFQSLLDKINAGENIEGDPKNDFLQLTDGLKVSRFNDKIRRLEALTKFDFSRGDQRSQYMITQQTELLFKASDQSNITFTNDEMLRMVELWQSYFPDYQILYKSIHHDENPDNPHMHLVVSNYNSRTKKYDLVQQEIEAMRKYYRKKHKTDELPDCLKKNSKKLTEAELTEFGKIKQNFFFDIVNTATKNKYKFTKRTPEEVEEDNHEYEKTKPITQREHNRQKKLQELAKRQKEQLQQEQSRHAEKLKTATEKAKTRLREKHKAEEMELEQRAKRIKNQERLQSQTREEIDRQKQQNDHFGSILDRLAEVMTKVSKWVGFIIKQDFAKAFRTQDEIKKDLEEITPELEKQNENRKALVDEMLAAASEEAEFVETYLEQNQRVSEDLKTTRKKVKRPKM